MTLEALIFDVDGTLADTEDVHRRAFNLVFERHRLGWVWQPPQYRELLSVAGGKERLAWFIDTLPVSGAGRVHLRRLVPTLHAEKNRCYRHLVMSGALRLRPGIERLMTEAREAGCRLAIATTTSAVNVESLLQATLGSAGPAMFSAIACGDEVRIKKPSPYVYHLALRRLGLRAHQAVAFEDSLNGLRSAVGAGLRTIVTPTYWSRHEDFSAASLELPHLGDPHLPIGGEPGHQLENAPWLSFAELARRMDGRTAFARDPVDELQS